MATLQFYPLEVTYKISSNKAVVWLFGRTQAGEQVCAIDEGFEPYFYVKPKEGENMEFLTKKILTLKPENRGAAARITNAEAVDKKILGKKIVLIRVTADIPPNVPVLRNAIKSLNEVENVYEADIPFARRYLIDRDITPFTLAEAEGEFINTRSRVPVFSIKKIRQISEKNLEEPKILSIDIETYNPTMKIDMKNNPILMVAFHGKNFEKIITWKKFKTGLKHIEFAESEAQLLEAVNRTIKEYSPDILTGYFSDSFDWPYIKERAEKHKTKLDFGLDFSSPKTDMRSSSTELGGMVSLDLYKFVQRIVGRKLNTETYKLGEVAEELIGEGKLEDAHIANLAEDWDAGKNLEIYCSYNLQDAKITYKLCEKLLPNILEMVKIVGLPITDVIGMGFSQLVEWYLLKQAPSFEEIAPNKPDHNQMRERLAKTYTGGFVYEPTPGLYKNIAVFDFRSMYPSIIASHNISPATLNCSCCEDESPAPVEKGKCWFCKKKKGFIPKMVEELIKRRMRVKDIMKKTQDEKTKKLLDARQESLKVLSNSFYGYLAFAAARWYSIESATAVTAYERSYIQDVIEKAKKEGYEVIYGDTDSVFLLLKKKKKEDALKFKDKINLELPELMELDFEGIYPAGIFVSVKAREAGAKKKYALLSEEGFIKIKGFETVRKNWSEIAKETQEKVLKMILETGNAKKAFSNVKKVIEELRDKKIPIEKTIIRTQLQKSIGSYESIGPHVAVASRMKEAGDSEIGPGSIIKYVIVAGTGKIRDRAKTIDELKEKESYDSDYYIENQVVPAVESILAVLGYKKEDLLSDRKQSRLEGFMK